MRTKVLALMAIAMAVVGIGVLPSLASAATPEAAAATPSTNPLVVTPMVQSECPGSYICFWSGKTFGQGECQSGLNCFSEFHGYEVGWHNLENINPQSMYNHTGEHWAIFYTGLFGEVELGIGPGQTHQFGGRWESGFEIR